MSKTQDVRSSIWSDPWFLSLKPRARYVYLWALTNAHAHVGGLYQVAEPLILGDTGLTREELDDALGDLKDKLTYRPATGTLWVHGRAKNIRAKTRQIARSIARQLEVCEDAGVRSAFVQKYGSKPWLRPEITERSEIQLERDDKPDSLNLTRTSGEVQSQRQGQKKVSTTERIEENRAVRALTVSSRVIARFEEAATVRKITVDLVLIGQALADYPQIENRDRIALDCAAWLRENAPKPKSKAEPRSAHLTLRNFLRGAEVNPKTAPLNLGQTGGATDPVEGVLPNYARRLGRTEAELRPVVAGLFAKTGSTPLLPEVHKALEAA